jgi:hypothetical protein
VSAAHHTCCFYAPLPLALGVTVVSPPTAGLAVVWVPCTTLELRTHLSGLSVSLGFNAWSSLPQQGLGREMSQW